MIPKKFVEECIYGIQASGDTKLSSIVRAIDDDIRPIYTEKRLSRNLDDETLESSVAEAVLKDGARSVRGDTLLLVDPPEIRKEFSYKMEFVTRVRDAKGRSVLSREGMHEVHDLARQPTTPRRSSSCRALPNSLTPTMDSRFGRETPKTTSRNALQPLSMRVQRISALKKWVNSSEGRGRKVDEWKMRPDAHDNHWFDGVVGCAVAASMCGCVLAGTDTVQARKPAKPKVKLSELRRAKKL